ncbi:hypothetical protein D3C71_2232980 [compost metagenome]
MGVNTALQVTPPSLLDRLETAPFSTVRSAVVKPVTASLKVMVTADVSPAATAVAATTMVAVGRTVSMA